MYYIINFNYNFKCGLSGYSLTLFNFQPPWLHKVVAVSSQKHSLSLGCLWSFPYHFIPLGTKPYIWGRWGFFFILHCLNFDIWNKFSLELNVWYTNQCCVKLLRLLCKMIWKYNLPQLYSDSYFSDITSIDNIDLVHLDHTLLYFLKIRNNIKIIPRFSEM